MNTQMIIQAQARVLTQEEITKYKAKSAEEAIASQQTEQDNEQQEGANEG